MKKKIKKKDKLWRLTLIAIILLLLLFLLGQTISDPRWKLIENPILLLVIMVIVILIMYILERGKKIKDDKKLIE